MNKFLKVLLSIVSIIVICCFIDIIFIFSTNKPLFAIKEDNGDSVNSIYRGLFYDVYNCNEYSMVQIKAKGIKFSCSTIKFEEDKKSSYIIKNLENLEFYISDITLTGATITLKDLGNNDYTYGEWYKIEKEINGEWYDVRTIIENHSFNGNAYLPDENNEVKFVIDWAWLYGELPVGSYRILKQINNFYIAIPFNIGTTYKNKLEVIYSTEYENANSYEEYLTVNDRKIYLKSNIQDVFYYPSYNSKISLKQYITNTYQPLDESIKNITNLIDLVDVYDDGGTSVYKSKDYNITIIICKSLIGNTSIYIGDFNLTLDYENMCG